MVVDLFKKIEQAAADKRAAEEKQAEEKWNRRVEALKNIAKNFIDRFFVEREDGDIEKHITDTIVNNFEKFVSLKYLDIKIIVETNGNLPEGCEFKNDQFRVATADRGVDLTVSFANINYVIERREEVVLVREIADALIEIFGGRLWPEVNTVTIEKEKQ
jgi:hypothetical protein